MKLLVSLTSIIQSEVRYYYRSTTLHTHIYSIITVEKNEEVKTEVNVVAPVETDIILPPDVEVVSFFYKIETPVKFLKPIDHVCVL